jgi:hypothetical protein
MLKDVKYIYVLDPKLKRKVLHKIEGNYAISLLTGRKLLLKPTIKVRKITLKITKSAKKHTGKVMKRNDELLKRLANM